ncbi:helix-turn-helix domain-containing protein, partial [Actinophytocola sp.]|uniref:helix-turn-helix domain-containing protein n=1 Tax=Actinophytocola sp. TaxID=1872138 RepID=UPI00389AC07F
MGNRYTSAAYRELGAMLRQVRTRAGLTSTELAHRLGWSLTTVSRMENGRRPSTTTDVIQYAVMCGAKMPDLPPLLEFTRVAERKQGYYLSDNKITGSLQSLIFHEAAATHVTVYEPLVVPGLLQTPAYARALITALNPSITAERLKATIRTRVERRRVLSVPNPAQFTFYLHEDALRRRIGTDEIMQEQLLQLVLTAALSNASIRIVPSAAAERSVFGGAFQMMEFPEHRPIVSVDILRFGGLILEDPDYVHDYLDIVPMLADVALDKGQSR